MSKFQEIQFIALSPSRCSVVLNEWILSYRYSYYYQIKNGVPVWYRAVRFLAVLTHSNKQQSQHLYLCVPVAWSIFPTVSTVYQRYNFKLSIISHLIPLLLFGIPPFQEYPDSQMLWLVTRKILMLLLMYFISSKKMHVKVSEITDCFIENGRTKFIWQQTSKIYL